MAVLGIDFGTSNSAAAALVTMGSFLPFAADLIDVRYAEMLPIGLL